MPFAYSKPSSKITRSGIISKRSRAPRESMMIDVFAGIDRSTARHRLAGGGALLYETKNVFPYIQGRLMRRRDYVTTNSRAANVAFPTFPAETMVGNPIIRKIIEFNNTICILYFDDGDASPQDLLVDSFDVGANTLTNRIAKADVHTMTASGKIDAAVYEGNLWIDCEGLDSLVQLTTGWVSSIISTGNAGNGVCETFLQSWFHVNNTAPDRQIGRTAPGATTPDAVTYDLAESNGNIIKLLSFGYQTSAEGAYTNLLIFTPTTIWLLTSLTAGAAIEQVTGNVGLAGKDAITRTPFGIVFVGRDSEGALNMYLLDKSSLTLHTIGHPLYELLQDVPKANQTDIHLSYHLNRMVRLAITNSADTNPNEQEWWIDFYNGIRNRTFWGSFPLGVQTMNHALGFSGGTTRANAGFFFMEKSGNDYLIREETSADTYQATLVNTDNQAYRTQLIDFGAVYGIITLIHLVALDNGAKFKVSYETQKGLTSIPVIWIDTVGVSVDDNTITMTASTGWGNAGAASAQSFINDGGAEHDVVQTNYNRFFGLSSTNTNAHWDTIEYAIHFQNTGDYHVYESGILKVSPGSFVVGDKFNVRRIGSSIVYQKNDVTFYTSAASISPLIPLMVDVAIGDTGGIISNVLIFKIYGTDDDTIITQINSTYQMGTTGRYVYKPIRLSPFLRVKQFGIKVESVLDATDNSPIEISQIGFDYIVTQRGVIE